MDQHQADRIQPIAEIVRNHRDSYDDADGG
jgi:hypothetical protein